MEAEFVEIFEVRGENDTTEGRGGTHIVGYTFSATDAEELAKGRGVWGGNGRVETVRGVQFADGSTYALGARMDEAFAKAGARAVAVAKLTLAERKLLGIE